MKQIYIEAFEPMHILRRSQLDKTQADMPGYVHLQYGSALLTVAVAVGAQSLEVFKQRFDSAVLIKDPGHTHYVNPGFLEHIAADCYNLSRQTSLASNPSFSDEVKVEIKVIH